MSLPKITLFLLIGLLWANGLTAQKEAERLARLERRLLIMIEEGTDLQKAVTISLTGSIRELVNFLAESTNTSMAIDAGVNRQVSVTFNKVPVIDILLYLCDNYSLDIQPTGEILYLVEYVAPDERPRIRPPEVSYNAASGLILLNLRQDTLSHVVQRISQLSGQNVTTDPLVRNRRVTTYVNNLPFEQALDQLASSNDLIIEQSDGYYILLDAQSGDPFGEGESATTADSRPAPNRPSTPNSGGIIQVRRSSDNRINVRAEDADLMEVVKSAARELGIDYYILADYGSNIGGQANVRNTPSPSRSTPSLDGQLITLQVQEVTFAELLINMFRNTGFTHSVRGDTYIIGPREGESLRATQVFQFQYRSARGVEQHIPAVLSQGVVIDSLYEFNSLVLTGSQHNIEEVTYFLHQLDKVVPVITIELTIMDVQSDKLEEYGVEAGLVSGGREAGGTIISGADDPNNGTNFTFSPQAVNRVLDLLAGQGVINLGQVSPDFYLSLSALQADGLVDIQSTPKLSTMNSHPAIMSIGQKRYYQEQQVNYPGFDRPIPVQAVVFREVEANLLISINPIVSGDEEVTLGIEFEQSEFLEDTGPNAPPPQVSRRFASTIRVRNGETIVLGGLERELKANSRRGLPWLSRIPGIGWLFGKQRKARQKNKLLILLKPTILN